MVGKPTPVDVWKAIEIYLGLAYDQGPPSAVRSRLTTLHSMPPEAFYDSPIFERYPPPPAAPTRYSIRIGNRWYPHMKLTIDRRPDQQGYLFRADTHDRHCCPPPGSREYGVFCQMMQQNTTLAQAIEKAWDEQRLPTFKAYLRDDLARRRQAAETTHDQRVTP